MKNLFLILNFLAAIPIFAQEIPLLNNKNPKVVAIAIRLEGTWLTDESLLKTEARYKEKFPDIEFKIDTSVAALFRKEYENPPAEYLDIYTAGYLKMFNQNILFVLLDFKGEPVLFYFGLDNLSGPREGVFNIKMAVGTKKSGDILYLDTEPGPIQSSFAFRRKAPRYNFSKENIVATHLVGTWTFDKKITKNFTKNTSQLIEIKVEIDSNIVEAIPYKYNQFLEAKPIYLAGYIELNKERFPFILIELNGNPHLVYFKDRDGKPMDNSESFNLFVTVGDNPKMDILWVGGDFNNQAFLAYKRKG